MCLFPELIKNKKYTATKKNGGIIPPVYDSRVLVVPIGCGNCIECKKQKAREWQVRLIEDIKENKNGKFITLTFNTESIRELTKKIWQSEKLMGYELDNEIATHAVRLFLERWRKKYKKSIRHWLVTELGGTNTENIHLHGIIWTDKPLEEVEKIWGYGYVWKGKEVRGKIENYVNEKTVNYIIKYINKIDEKHKTYRSKILTSKGIGKRYTKEILGDWRNNKFKDKETDEAYRTPTGIKRALPIYYRNKIYSEEEREKLWLMKLDKEERYVLGKKISIKKGEKEYYSALKRAQELNQELGYGDNIKNWELYEYERERRILKQKERIYNKKNNKNIKGGTDTGN